MNNQQQMMCTAILVLCVALGLYFIIPKVQSAINVYNEVSAKTATVENAKKQIEDLKNKKAAYEKEERVSTKPVYKNELATPDQMSSFGVMFEDVIQSAKYNGLKLRSISYNTAPAGDVVQTNMSMDYNVCAISMQLIGNYMQFRSYFQDIYNYPYLINLDQISIVPYEKNKKILIADITVILYSTKNAAQKIIAQQAAAAENQGDEAVEGTGAVASPDATSDGASPAPAM